MGSTTDLIEADKNIPGHIALLLNENLAELPATGARKKLRGMLRDLKDQVLASAAQPLEPSGGASQQFNVFLSSGLDLFGGSGACMHLACRVQYCDQVARSVALMADTVSVHDFFGDFIMDMNRPTNAELDSLLEEVSLLHRLRPLISAGILGFRSPMMAICQGCASEFSSRVDKTTQVLFSEFASTMSVERSPDGSVSIDSGQLYDPHLFHRINPGFAATRTDEELIFAQIYNSVRDTLWDARDASMQGGALFSNSRIGLSGMLIQENRIGSSSDVRILEGHRAAQLPWVSGLTVEQTLQLREEASVALPRLREFLARHLAARPVNTAIPTKAEEYVQELREQAAEVKAELQIATRRSGSLAKNTLGILGLGIAALGFATEAESSLLLTELLTTLGLIHGIGSDSGDHAAALTAKPGYVLVAAEEILAHAK
jgi:hypothetical protein